MSLGRWICMVLEWTAGEASLLQDGPFSAAASCSLHLKRSMGDSEPPHFPTGYTLGPGDRRLCTRLVLCHLH